MDWSSPDPNNLYNHHDDEDEEDDVDAANKQKKNKSKDKKSSHTSSTTSSFSTYDDTVASLVPSHMRIAGRVTGQGLFHYTAEDQLIQQAADDRHERSKRMAPAWNRKLHKDDEAFPSLGDSRETSSSSKVSSKATQATKPRATSDEEGAAGKSSSTKRAVSAPPSAVNSSLAAIMGSVTTVRTKPRPGTVHQTEVTSSESGPSLLEDRVLKRSLDLASAFGLSSSHSSALTLEQCYHQLKALQTPPSDAMIQWLSDHELFTMLHTSYFDITRVESATLIRLLEVLLRPIYTPCVLAFARNMRPELLKVEKK